MSKEEFMRELEYLLSDIPEEEKRDALEYYRDYLEEAGETAAEAMKEFGSPERIASILRTDLQGVLEKGGEFTERGYEDERFRDPNYQMAKRYDLPETREGQAEAGGESGREGRQEAGRQGHKAEKPKQQSVWRMVLLALLVVAASPVLLGIGGGILGITVGLGGGFLGVLAGLAALFLAAVVTLAILTFALLLAGFAICVVGIIAMFSNVLNGLLCFGVGLVVLSIGLIFLVISIWFYGKMIPWLIRVLVNAVSRLVHRKERAA